MLKKFPHKFVCIVVCSLCCLFACKKNDDHIKVDCNIHEGQCVKQKDNFEISFDINPKPVKSMADIVFSALIKEGGSFVHDASVIIDLTMPGMYMGENKIVLKHIRDGFYEGKGLIVRCPSGQRLWKAEVIIKKNGQSRSVSYLFETAN
jgi:hypothetical protein